MSHGASSPTLPPSAAHVVVGGGVHGLSVAAALARRRAGAGLAPGVVVLERATLGSGASGIAGGIVRGYYRSPAIMELVRMSVERFERSPEAFGFRQVGFASIVPERQLEDLVAIAARQAEVGYASDLVTGNADATEYLTWRWPDFDASGVAAVLHERRSGWADAAATVRELARDAREAGALLLEDTAVLALEREGGRVAAVVTSRGTVRADHVVIAVGLWAADAWRMLGLDFSVDAGRGPEPLVTLVRAQEGDFALPGVGLAAAAGHQAPVIHFDAEGPLRSDRDGRVLTEDPWGIYFRMGRTGTAVTVGGLPEPLAPDSPIDPYGPQNPAHVAGETFCEFAQAGLARVLRRFRGAGMGWRSAPHWRPGLPTARSRSWRGRCTGSTGCR